VARRGSKFVVTRGMQRKTEWVRSLSVTGFTSLAGVTAVLDQSIAFSEPVTIVRTRGHIICISDQEAANEEQVGAVGACIVSDPAFAVGVTAIPTPTTDQDSDLWFMHQFFGNSYKSTGDIHGITTPFAFDSKAMRKIETETRLVVVVENSGTFGFDFLLQFAMLFKLA